MRKDRVKYNTCIMTFLTHFLTSAQLDSVQA